VLLGGVVLGVTIGGLMFINPEFLNTRWPWLLDPFDARIMGAFPVGAALWAARMHVSTDWAEIKLGMQGMILYATGLFVVWLANLVTGQFDPSRLNILTYGIVVGVAAALLGYFYWRQERAAGLVNPARPKVPARSGQA
jgi:hypothetical protein